MRHHGPLLGRDVFNVIVDQRFQSASRLLREGSGKNHGISECSRLLSNRGDRSIVSVPDLSSSKHDDKGKQHPQWRQHTSGECSSAYQPAGRKLYDYCVDDGDGEITATKKQHCHPCDRQVMEPITKCAFHVFPLRASSPYNLSL